MNPVTIILLLHTMQSEAGRQAEQRIKQAQYCAAVEARAQHREIERPQPGTHLTPAEEAGNRKAAADRLIGPERIENNSNPDGTSSPDPIETPSR